LLRFNPNYFFSHFCSKLNLPKWGGSSFMPYNKKPQLKQNRRKNCVGYFYIRQIITLRGLKRKSQTHDQRIRGLQIKKTETFEWKFKNGLRLTSRTMWSVIYIHTYIHTYILHTYTHTHIHTHIHTYIHTYKLISQSFNCQRSISDLEGFVPNSKVLCKRPKMKFIHLWSRFY
jgi:hypothetical protein